ncbi:hypothetical protein K435DRAFT_857972 [Dendrothele bispora CBS 962.96]|uniref:Uncharacterized protein n=1 Tax=Dendrothele bispora (strain CBS 962.96) TaxID=1314807 RepID=A0A4S8M4E2_DENBC|nr:hypothetical protein K435DRAFT_857972 [Dendrothele bispora CBS 962.96]
MASLSFRARPGAVVRVAQTAAGPALRVEDSGSSTLDHYISNGSAELDVHVDLNTTGLTISVIPAASELISTEVLPQPQGILVFHWTHDHVWPSSASDADSPLLYNEENNSTYSSPNSCHSDILELNTLLSSLQARSTLDSAGLDPLGLRNVNNMQDGSDAALLACGSSRTDSRDIHRSGPSGSVQDNHISVVETPQNLTFSSGGGPCYESGRTTPLSGT